MIDALFESLTMWHWLGLGVILVIIDITAGTSFFFLWLGVCAGTVALVLSVIPDLSWNVQVIIFAVESLACMVFWYAYLSKHPTISDKPRLNRRSEQYIGRSFTLKEPIEHGHGKIRVDDSSWKVEGPDLPAGAKIKIVDANGVVLIVEEMK